MPRLLARAIYQTRQPRGDNRPPRGYDPPVTRRDEGKTEGDARQKLRPSREVYDQIRWDPRLDPAAFTIGYDTRDAGTEEIPLPSFDPEGEIPWHRIHYIRRGPTHVWDRRRRVDLLARQRRDPLPSAPGGLAARPVHRSALALIPPTEVWAPIEAIRQAHDKHAARWMPHINLLYAFLPEGAFPEARRAVAEALLDFAPFEVTLDELRVFRHRSSSTVWLHPRSEPPGALEALQAKLEGMFPQCREQSTASASGFTPHLSIAQVPPSDDIEARLADWQRILPIAFPVRSIQFISRRDDEPFVVRYAVPLGGRLEVPVK